MGDPPFHKKKWRGGSTEKPAQPRTGGNKNWEGGGSDNFQTHKGERRHAANCPPGKGKKKQYRRSGVVLRESIGGTRGKKRGGKKSENGRQGENLQRDNAVIGSRKKRLFVKQAHVGLKEANRKKTQTSEN